MAVQPQQDRGGAEPSRREGAKEAQDSDDDSDVESEADRGDEERTGDAGVGSGEEERVAVACDDGCVRLFTVEGDTDGLQYLRTLPKVKGEGRREGESCRICVAPTHSGWGWDGAGRVLSLAWNSSGTRVFAGGSDG